MKLSFSILLFCMVAYTATSQVRSYSWTDRSVQINAVRRINLDSDTDGPCSVVPCYKTSDNHLIYDSVINFLKNNERVIIEATLIHTSDDTVYHDMFVRMPMLAFKNEIVGRGMIEPDRIQMKEKCVDLINGRGIGWFPYDIRIVGLAAFREK